MKTTKIYKLVTDGDHDYDVMVTKENDTTKYEMFYSESKIWSHDFRGTLIHSAVDNGDGIKLDKKIKKKMEYFEFGTISTFIKFICDIDKYMTMEYEYLVNENLKNNKSKK